MNRFTCFLAIVCLLTYTLSGCGGGNVSQTQMVIGESVLFAPGEIENAMEVAMNHFRREFDGCTMTKIEYIEAKSEPAAKEWAQQYGAEEAIVLYSSFEVGESGSGRRPGCSALPASFRGGGVGAPLRRTERSTKSHRGSARSRAAAAFPRRGKVGFGVLWEKANRG
jgi:hypothetical protein